MKIDNITSMQPVISSSTVVSGDTISCDKKIAIVNNSADIDLSSLKLDENKILNFRHYIFSGRQKTYSESFNSMIQRYHSYPGMTVGEYRQAKNYPSGKDLRPDFFDPKGDNTAAHGTHLEALLQASVNCNLQLAAGLKSFKLLGKQHESGEGAKTGTSHLNCKYVSTVALICLTSSFSDVKKYAKYATSCFLKGNENIFNKIPVVVIGDGVSKCNVSSDISNEVGYKRLNIRIVAFENEEDKNIGTQWLRKVRDEFDISEINSLKICTYKELDAIMRYHGFNHPDTDLPNISSLWQSLENLN